MFSNLTPMVKRLLIINIGIHILANLAPGDTIRHMFSMYNPILPGTGDLMNPKFKIWQIFTYMFLHSGQGMMHLFSNMFALFIFGPAIEMYMGSKKFLKYYVICGLGAVLIYIGVNYLEFINGPQTFENITKFVETKMLGASGAVFGILIAFAMLFPNIEMMLIFLPIPIKAKYFVGMYAIFEFMQGFKGAATGIAHWAHIGGLITGILLLTVFGYKKRNFY